MISENQGIDEKRLQSILDSYFGNLQRFAEISGRDVLIARIEALAEQMSAGEEKILAGQRSSTEQILDSQRQMMEKLEALERKNSERPLPIPAKVEDEVRSRLIAKADEANAAYRRGYELLGRYRFREAVPLLQRALAIIKLPEFYLALGHAYQEMGELASAATTLQEGLDEATRVRDEESEASLAGSLTFVLQDQGNLEGALRYSQSEGAELDSLVKQYVELPALPAQPLLRSCRSSLQFFVLLIGASTFLWRLMKRPG